MNQTPFCDLNNIQSVTVDKGGECESFVQIGTHPKTGVTVVRQLFRDGSIRDVEIAIPDELLSRHRSARITQLEGALNESRAALYGAKEVCGDIGNISHAICMADSALSSAEGEKPKPQNDDGRSENTTVSREKPSADDRSGQFVSASSPSPSTEQVKELGNIDMLRQQAQWYGTRNPSLRDLLLWAADALSTVTRERDAARKIVKQAAECPTGISPVLRKTAHDFLTSLKENR